MNCDYRQNPEYTRLTADVDRLAADHLRTQSDLEAARVQAKAADEALAELEATALLDAAAEKKLPAARKSAQDAAGRVTELEKSLARYRRALEMVGGIVSRKAEGIKREAATALRGEYERCLAAMVSALEAAAECNKKLVELQHLDGVQFWAGDVHSGIGSFSWSELDSAPSSKLNDWLLEVAAKHPAVLPETHPARLKLANRLRTDRENDRRLTERLERERAEQRENAKTSQWPRWSNA